MLKPILDHKPELFRQSRSVSKSRLVEQSQEIDQNAQVNNANQQQIANEMPVFSNQQAAMQSPAVAGRAHSKSFPSKQPDSSNHLENSNQNTQSQTQTQKTHHSHSHSHPSAQSQSHLHPQNPSHSQLHHISQSDAQTQTLSEPEITKHVTTYYNPNSRSTSTRTVTTRTMKFINGVQVDQNNQPIVQQQQQQFDQPQQQQHTTIQQPVVAQLKEIRVHTVPVQEQIVRYVMPSAQLVEETSSKLSKSSSSTSSSSSSSSVTSETSQDVVLPQPQTTTTIVQQSSAPLLAGPDCESPGVLQRIIMAPAPVTTTYRVVHHQPATTITTSRLVSAPAAPVAAVSGPESREEHFHTETRSIKESSDGLGNFSSSSSSRTSKSSKSSSSSSTTTVQEIPTVVSHSSATLLAPVPAPVVTKTITTTTSRLIQPEPLVSVVRAAPLIALTQPAAPTTNTQVNVDHHFRSPNVNYGYSIKQTSSEPSQQQTKGLLVGERVVYLK